MDNLQEFESDLHDALVHLYDPIYSASRVVCAVFECETEEGLSAVQLALAQFIENTKADPTVLSDSRVRRYLEILYQRFLIKLTQEALAEHMAISARSVQRLQREAVHMFAVHLWESKRGRLATKSAEEATGWQGQLKQELVVLAKSSPSAESDLENTVQGVLRVAHAAATNGSITFETIFDAPNLRVKLHPAVLREVLNDAITGLASRMSSGKISLDAKRVSDHVSITITADPLSEESTVEVALARELITAQRGSISTVREGERLSLVIDLPPISQTAQTITVLAVDDNPDLVALYESYCAETAYRIVHVQEGRRVLQAITDHSPAIILLDVMLPDVDGWDLLLDLHANPATRTIPIIVCSVVTDEKLAQKLGATACLRKPVWQKQLIAAFDNCLGLQQSRPEITRTV